jgi:hypothetical protein
MCIAVNRHTRDRSESAMNAEYARVLFAALGATRDNIQMSEAVTPLSTLRQQQTDARHCWLAATQQSDLDEVEHVLKRIIEDTKQGTKATADPEYRSIRDTARQRLLLLLCQAGRDKEAAALMKKAGFVARLSPAVLNYATEGGAVDESAALPTIVADQAVSEAVLRSLDANFLSIEAPYWTAHGYAVEPPTPYFSYVVPIEQCASAGSLGPLGAVVRAAMDGLVRYRGADVAGKVQYAELWAHNRPHPSGHQMHFDSDDEGRLGVRNPIASSVLFLTTGVGGPTVVTNQRLTDATFARRAWAAFPRRGRMVLFNGDLLHGVVPGKGLPPTGADGRRVTVMVALWEHVTIREGSGPGAARPLPPPESTPWCAALTRPFDDPTMEATQPRQVPPLVLEPVWVTVDGAAMPAGQRLPPYEKSFQGF